MNIEKVLNNCLLEHIKLGIARVWFQCSDGETFLM